MEPQVDPRTALFRISKAANDQLERLGLFGPGVSPGAKTRALVSAHNDIEVLPVQESHFLAKATVHGVPAVLFCLSTPGSPRGDKQFSTIIRGAFDEATADELIAIGRGLAPFSNEARQSIGERANYAAHYRS